jgi:small subunit ribosomal protein S9
MVKDEKAEEDKKKKAKPKAAKAPKEEAQKAPAPRTEGPKLEVVTVAPPQKAEAKPEPAAAAPAPKEKARKKKASKKAAKKVCIARGKRKESVARATIQEGKGGIRVNSQSLSSLPNPYIREIIREPLRYIGPEANNVDISVNVNGGGMMGQAQAARTAIANALVLYFDQMNLREKFIEIDRTLVIEDTRRVESKKFRGPKARARFQKSYR